MTKDRKVRTAITKESFSYFFHFYYAHYVKYATADFQKEIIHLIEMSDRDNLFVVAFRGSGKSTMVTTAYPIWAILGKQQKRFVVIFCQTQAQAKQHMMNLRRELEDNELLKNDLGPFKEDSDEWGSQSLVFKNTDARITVASSEQSIRGIRHHEHRPDLIICDDVEDITSTKTREGRNKTYQWLKGEVIPAGDKNTRLIVVGNLLHEDSLLMRLKEDIVNDKIDGKFLFFPLINDKEECLWPGKYPTQQDINNERRKIGNDISWQREYLLNIVSDEDQVIHTDWIQYYDEIPPFDDDHNFRFTATGIDLAISQKDTADYTAMVSAHVFGYKDELKIYIAPNPVNKRMVHKDTLDTAMNLSKTLGNGDMTWILVEDVGYQKSVVQELKRAGYPAVSVKVHGSDKRSRLALTSHLVQSGVIQFPKKGAELLISQMTGFGKEKHDDLADAFSLLINKVITLDHERYVTGFWFLKEDGEWGGKEWTVKGKEFEDD